MSTPSNPPIVSVVMAVYNSERYLEEAIQSILNQTFRDFELIIIDDGSTDKSTEILKKYAGLDTRIRLVTHENKGLTKSLNVGLSMARGEFIARMDGDDVADLSRFAKQLNAFKRDSNLVLLGSEVELITEDGFPLGPRGQPSEEVEIRRRLLQGDSGVVTHPAVMFRANVAQSIGGYDERFSTTQDLDLFLKLSELGTIGNLPETLLQWRQHEKSVNRTKSNTWAAMKRLAVAAAIGRIGVERYLEQVFPFGTTFSFPQSPLELSRLARRKGRRESAKLLLLSAIKDPANQRIAIEEWIENAILGVWWKIRNGIRRITSFGS
jgi:glycosyltransferase involved in cell wall biosynthesis